MTDAFGSPLAVDLFCGYGGWAKGLLAAGYRVVGIDNEPKCAERYPGEFRLADVRTIAGSQFRGARLIVASPPCQRFSEARASRVTDPATEADLDLLREALRIIQEANPAFWVVENVRGAVPLFSKVMGPPRYKRRPFYLWGNFPPMLLRQDGIRKLGWLPPKPGSPYWRSQPKHRDPRVRAMLPAALTVPIAEACL